MIFYVAVVLHRSLSLIAPQVEDSRVDGSIVASNSAGKTFKQSSFPSSLVIVHSCSFFLCYQLHYWDSLCCWNFIASFITRTSFSSWIGFMAHRFLFFLQK